MYCTFCREEVVWGFYGERTSKGGRADWGAIMHLVYHQHGYQATQIFVVSQCQRRGIAVFSFIELFVACAACRIVALCPFDTVCFTTSPLPWLVG